VKPLAIISVGTAKKRKTKKKKRKRGSGEGARNGGNDFPEAS
jgi:hypothetical protein